MLDYEEHRKVIRIEFFSPHHHESSIARCRYPRTGCRSRRWTANKQKRLHLLPEDNLNRLEVDKVQGVGQDK
jgi:hypothetical protein